MQITKYVHPLLDTPFKKIFGTDANKDLLLNLLNAIFSGRKQLIDLQYNKNEHHGEHTEEALAIFDLLCTTDRGEKILIEVQHNRPLNFKKRGIYYTSRLISEQSPKGKVNEWEYDISEVCFIAILDQQEHIGTKDKLLSDGRYLHDACLRYRHTPEIFYDGLGFIFIELLNFTKSEEECDTELDRWLYELKHMPERQNLPSRLRSTIFEKLYAIGEYTNLTKEEQKMYDQELKRKWDNAAVLSQAKLEGKEEGEATKSREIAEKLKNKGMDIAEIADLTGLSIEEVEKL